MANGSIDVFPFLKQRKADVSPVFLYRDHLAISADYLYGSLRVTARTHKNFLKEIKEDI